MELTGDCLLTGQCTVCYTVGLDILTRNNNACTLLKLLTAIESWSLGVAYINLDGTIALCHIVLVAREDTLLVIVYYNKVFHEVSQTVCCKTVYTAELCSAYTILLLGQSIKNLQCLWIELVYIGPEFQSTVCLWFLGVIVE